ncbi:MAG: L,D-transpeptidase [Deltaproteobacteria bacterium]|nr:L,D-transpeptidase [Deltaproteobacteria bacterium]
MRLSVVIASVVVMLSLVGAVAAAGVLALGQWQPDGSEPPAAPDPAPVLEAPDRHVEINLTTQMLKAYEDDTLVYEFKISSGPRTPTGTYRIWKKHRMKDMKVGMVVKDDYYVLEDVPYIMFYFNDELTRERGFAIHGAYWHQDFGKPVSHGCINMRVEEARMLFDWTGPRLGSETDVVEAEGNPGTPVRVYGSPAGG